MKWLGGVLLAYGIVMIALGVLAYFKDNSLMSLIGGGGIGVLVIFGAALAQNYQAVGYGIAAVGAVAALGRFIVPVLTKQQIYPAGVIAALSGLVLICLAIGHFQMKDVPPDVPSDEESATGNH